MSISQIPLGRMAPQARAALIYASARAELSNRLWAAALGDAPAPVQRPGRGVGGGDLGLSALVTLLDGQGIDTSHVPVPPSRSGTGDMADDAPPRDRRRHDHETADADDGKVAGLGANAGYACTLSAAAARTGMPAAVIAAIVHAEAATGSDGRWQTYSRNPRSSAAGLGQFLTGTWISETERAGTWLHALASEHGWLDDRGRVTSQARAPLLALRYDGDASIQAIADYAQFNVAQIRASGAALDDRAETLAQSAYLGHHLGVKDAIRFLSGTIDPGRARHLLAAQIGAAAAEERIAVAGDPIRAHRQWLSSYISAHVQPTRYAATFGVNTAG